MFSEINTKLKRNQELISTINNVEREIEHLKEES